MESGFFKQEEVLTMRDRVAEEYRKYYADINFERAKLFELIKDEYGCTTALYPGSSIHITPSFYFQHTVYVDISERAREFFGDIEGVRKFVEGSRQYRQNPYIQFINSDYTKPLPLREKSFDLLISLYAPAITASCSRFVRKGGLILTNNHLGDAAAAAADEGMELQALIRRKGKKYEIGKPDERILREAGCHDVQTGNIRRTNTGIEYRDTELYYVLKKI
jgi:hypothetical protein